MFSTSVRGGKAFAAKQKIREPKKKRIVRIKSSNKKQKNQTKPYEIICKETNSMNRMPPEKYEIEPETIEKEGILPESFRIKFDFHRLEKVRKMQTD